MEAIAAGFGVLAATAAIIALGIGAFNGALFWRVKSGLAVGGLFSVAVYLVVAIAFLGQWILVALYWGVPPLIMSFLISYLMAHWLHSRASLSAIWATFAALDSALIMGFLYLLTFRLGLWVPILIALVANASLIVLTIRARKPVMN